MRTDRLLVGEFDAVFVFAETKSSLGRAAKTSDIFQMCAFYFLEVLVVYIQGLVKRADSVFNLIGRREGWKICFFPRCGVVSVDCCNRSEYSKTNRVSMWCLRMPTVAREIRRATRAGHGQHLVYGFTGLLVFQLRRLVEDPCIGIGAMKCEVVPSPSLFVDVEECSLIRSGCVLEIHSIEWVQLL